MKRDYFTREDGAVGERVFAFLFSSINVAVFLSK